MEDDQPRAMTSEPDPRVFFAAERTFLAWIRTGLALMGFGFVVARFGLFLREIAAMQGGPPPPAGLSRWFGIGLIALGVLLTAASTATHVLTATCAKIRTARLRGVTIIEFEHAAEALTALERA
jgi:uncharacterized membrane protein YidH (DUF202 family)